MDYAIFGRKIRFYYKTRGKLIELLRIYSDITFFWYLSSCMMCCYNMIFCVIFGLLLQGATATAQTGDFRLLAELPLSARTATINNLDQVCIITPDNAIEKYSTDGRLLARYSGNRAGMATTLDVSNPLKTLVWYADFRIAVFLDRSLAVLGELNLIQAGFPETRTLAQAQDGNLWLYDEVNFRLVKLTPEGQLLYESLPLNQVLPQKINITCIREREGRVWAADPALGLLEFDVYGQFQRLIDEKGIAQFEIVNDYCVWVSGSELLMRHRHGFAPERRALPTAANESAEISVGNRRILLVQPEKILLYRW